MASFVAGPHRNHAQNRTRGLFEDFGLQTIDGLVDAHPGIDVQSILAGLYIYSMKGVELTSVYEAALECGNKGIQLAKDVCAKLTDWRKTWRVMHPGTKSGLDQVLEYRNQLREAGRGDEVSDLDEKLEDYMEDMADFAEDDNARQQKEEVHRIWRKIRFFDSATVVVKVTDARSKMSSVSKVSLQSVKRMLTFKWGANKQNGRMQVEVLPASGYAWHDVVRQVPVRVEKGNDVTVYIKYTKARLGGKLVEAKMGLQNRVKEYMSSEKDLSGSAKTYKGDGVGFRWTWKTKK